MTTKKQNILVACDTDEGKQFILWLLQHSHNAHPNNDTGNYVDGIWTSTDEHSNQIINNLWDNYCENAP